MKKVMQEVQNVIATTVSDTALNMDIDALARMKLAINITEALIDALAPYVTQAEGTAATAPKRAPRKRRSKAEINAAKLAAEMTPPLVPEPTQADPSAYIPPKPVDTTQPARRGPPAAAQPFAG